VVPVVPSQFLEGGPGSSYLYPQGLLAFATPPFLFVFLCVVATWLPLLPLHRDKLQGYSVCVSHLEDQGVRVGEVGGTWIEAEGGKYTSHELWDELQCMHGIHAVSTALLCIAD